MIKINLLGSPKPKRGKRAATAVTEFSGGSSASINPILLIVIFAMVGGALAGFMWWKANNDAATIATNMQRAEGENRRLSAVKAKYDQEQRVKESYEHRVKVIDELRAAQAGPVNLLTMIGDTVNGTDAVWLSTVQDAGANINIEGTALSANAVANLIKNLQKTGYFKTVEMTETQQDPGAKELQTFIFKLTCEKQKS